MVLPLLTDAQFNALALIAVAAIGIVPATLGALWARTAKSNSASALQEVQTNGGMGDPHPNLNDHVKYQTEMAESLIEKIVDIDQRLSEHLVVSEDVVEKVNAVDTLLGEHIEHSKMMDMALLEVYLEVKPTLRFKNDEH